MKPVRDGHMQKFSVMFFLCLVHFTKQTIASVLRFIVVSPAGWETAPVVYYCEKLLPCSVSG